MGFIEANFLLETRESQELYFDYAQDLPIIDYHNHLPPADIASNRNFANITEAWLEDDHYKWRAMRANGVNERFITGVGDPLEKFRMWAKTVPATLRNPLYHWTHLELKRYFKVDKLLDVSTADEIYQHTQSELQTPEMSCRGLLKSNNVESLCTTDDPADTLEYHKKIASDSTFNIKVLPTFRPDRAFSVGDVKSYNRYLGRLEEVADREIRQLADLIEVLAHRIKYFHQHGCRLADHGLNRMPYLKAEESTAKTAFKDLRAGKEVSAEKAEQLQTYILLELCKMYHAHGWTQQFHLGALRSNSQRALRELGPDTGFDSIGDFNQALTLSAFLDELDNTDQLAKTILYNLNPRDNELMATMAGNFNDGKIVGKMQFGSGWWFLDQKDGMEQQMNVLSNMGLLSRFVGMLTDSRSFLSYPRHEYFRRILCNLLGADIAKGLLPNDMRMIGDMVQNICYRNAKNYFNF